MCHFRILEAFCVIPPLWVLWCLGTGRYESKKHTVALHPLIHGFRDLVKAPARLAPFMAAGFAAVVALAFANVDFDDMTALTLIGVAVVSTDVAARSQYRTTRPSAASLANL